MALTDDQFREAFKPLHVPSEYNTEDTKENKVIFILAQFGTATSDEVAAKIDELEPGYLSKGTMLSPDNILRGLYEKGLIRGSEWNGQLRYDLGKITRPNDGKVDPDLLAPGLD